MEKTTDLNVGAVQKACLRIFDEFDSVCRERGLRYYMACGTMLGAVRHKGYIPWDDDVDVYMPRPDYETLKQHASEWLPARLKFVDNTTDITFPHYFGKIEDTSTTMVERSYLGHYGGVWIDLFPIDGAPDDAQERRAHIKRFKHWRRLQYFVYRNPWKHGFSAGGILVWIVQKLYSKQYVNRRLEAIVKEYGFEDHNLLMPHNDKQKTFTKQVLGPAPVEYDFEGRRFYGVKDYDAYLKIIFGDYMKLPPVEERTAHHDIACFDPNLPIAEYLRREGK